MRMQILNWFFYASGAVCVLSLLLVGWSSWSLRRAQRRSQRHAEFLRGQEKRRRAKRGNHSC